MSNCKVIVGLGNPGKKYEQTRHNFGFKVVQSVAQRYHLKFSRKLLLKSFLAEGTIGSERFYLLMPLTFMNNSGWAVKHLLSAKKVDCKNILVVEDDLNLDFGQLRLRQSGSAGGHNGLSSIITHLKSEEFSRLKAGIGRPQRKDDVVDYVLSDFTQQENTELRSFIERAADCCQVWLEQGIAEAMGQYNKKKE